VVVTGTGSVTASITRATASKGRTSNVTSSGAEAAWQMGTGMRSTAVVEERRTEGKRGEKGEP
jgi:hypothetical protein